jgi:hypothetical protein
MVRVRDAGLHLRIKSPESSMINTYGFHLLKSVNKVSSAITPSPRHGGDFEVVETRSFDDRIDAFWEKVKEHYNFILEKSSRYLNWRYCDPRGGNYRVMQAVKDGEVLGFIVTELKNTGSYAEGYVVDLLTLPERLDVADTLLRDACRYFDDLGVNAVHYLVVRGHPYQGLSSRAEFIDTTRTSNMHLFCDFNEAEREYEVLKSSPPSRVHFNIGDYF